MTLQHPRDPGYPVQHPWALSTPGWGCPPFSPQLSEKYGPVFSLRFGSQRVVVVFGYEALREVLVTRGDEFTARGRFPIAEKASQNLGLFMSNGAAWAQTRRFTLATLRDFGMGKRGLEEQVQEETGLLLQELARTQGRPLDPGTLLTAAVGNTICRILFGHRFDYGDEQYLDALRRVAQNFLLESSAIGKLYNILPGLLERLPGSHWTFFHNTFFVQDFLSRKVEENAVAGEPTTAPRDFADAFLRKMEQEKENPETAFTQDNLRVTVFDVFLAGTETTSMTLRYCLMVLLRHPDVAEKIHEEIDRVIGTERAPALRDRAAMPYTDAVIHEVQRFLDLIPLGFIRTVTRDTPLGGFTIPKGCTIYPVLSSALKDPRFFKNPETFDPQHFLDEKGAFKKNEAFIPFSAGGLGTPPPKNPGGRGDPPPLAGDPHGGWVTPPRVPAGKRMCLGESMARTQLFLFLTALLQRFRLRVPPGEAPPDLSPRVSGISNVPWALRVCFCPH
uniref:Uncharacterized protein n=1 Tax=Anas zonorhyncha TaxID=75864 RepID=A0A8B9ZUQ0_9AVES